MTLLNRFAHVLKSLRAKPMPATPSRIGALFTPLYAPAAGWWRDDPTEQLRQY